MNKSMLTMDWSGHSYVEESLGEFPCFVTSHEADICAWGESDEPALIGKFRAHFVDLPRAIAAGNLIYLLESMAGVGDTVAYADLIDNEFRFTPEVEAVAGSGIQGRGFVVLGRLELAPEARGAGIGRKVISHAALRLSPGAELVLIEPYPLQYERDLACEDVGWQERLMLSRLPGTEEDGRARLSAHYAGMGFAPIADTPFMAARCGWFSA